VPRVLKQLLLSTTIFIYSTLSFAQSISIIYNPESSYQTRFLNSLSTYLSSSKTIQINTINSTELSSSLLQNNLKTTIVNLDSNLIGEIITLNFQSPTFHAMTTLASARQHAPCLPSCLNSLELHRFFVLDQPAARQLGLIQLISPTFKDIAVIVTNYSAPHLNELKQVATKKKLIINGHLTDATNLRFRIDDISKKSDIILAIADTDIYNSSSLSQVLLTSYRHKTPIIGFSKGFIKAGAMAGSVSDLQQLVQHLGEHLLLANTLAWLKSGNLIYPKYFDIISNRRVSKSLNIHFPSDEQLKQQLSAHEGLQ